MGQKKVLPNWKMQRKKWKKEQRKTSLGTIHPSKGVQGGKEDRRFVYKETSRGHNEGSYHRREKKVGRWEWVIRQEEAAPGTTPAGY